MHILITGGAGFIGSNLCQFLLDKGHIITCIDNLSSGYLSNIKSFHDNFTFINADIITYNFNQLPSDIEQIYHLSCPASPKSYQSDPIQTAKTNFIGTMNLLEFIKFRNQNNKDNKDNKNIRILFTSTSEIYGDPLEHPQKESYWGHCNPIGIRSCYDEGKRIAETLMFDYQRIHNIDIRVVRIFNTYGPNMDIDDGRVVSNFICQALQNKDITIYGNGSQTRSCCYVSDTVQGLYTFMNQSKITSPCNIGNPYEITIKDLAYLIMKLIPESTSKIIYQSLPSDDPKIRQPDITKIKEIWIPKIDLEDGLRLSIKYFEQII